MVAKSIVVTGIAQDLEGSEDDILRNAEVQEEISTILERAKKRANTSGVGESNNYYEDIYIPPYNNTH